jgi:hypothetical protein
VINTLSIWPIGLWHDSNGSGVVVHSVQDDIARVFSLLILLFVLRVIFTIVVVDIFVLSNDNV